MTKFHEYILNEKLIPVDPKDIDLIYKPLDPYIKALEKIFNYLTPFHKITSSFKVSGKEMTVYGTMEDFLYKHAAEDLLDTDKSPVLLQKLSSGKLVSETCKAAHKIKPVTIWVYNRVSANMYEPLKNKIHLGFVTQYVRVLREILYLPPDQFSRFRNEFTETRVRSTIRHELAHWLDDSLNNLNISKMINKINVKIKEGDRETADKIFKQGHGVVNMTPREVNAVANQIETVKNQLGDYIWDTMTWQELEDTISSIYSRSMSPENSYEFRKIMKKRLAREKLLGKNMR